MITVLGDAFLAPGNQLTKSPFTGAKLILLLP